MQEFLSGVTAPMREDCEPCMVKYQDTDAYKKATDVQLRHRDALEKEIRQRELDPIYVDTAIRRWQRYTGDAAVHAVTKTPFDSVQKKLEDHNG
jgi:hypothetical protein